MAGSKGNISFAHAHLYVDFDNDFSAITGDAAAMWTALKTKFPVGDYINQANSVSLPVQTANTIPIQNMGAESEEKLADLPCLLYTSPSPRD